MNNIHAHEALDLIKENSPFSKKEDIIILLNNNFIDSKFFTCSKENLSSEDLVIFLLEKDKIIETDDGFIVNLKNICNH